MKNWMAALLLAQATQLTAPPAIQAPPGPPPQDLIHTVLPGYTPILPVPQVELPPPAVPMSQRMPNPTPSGHD